MASIKWETSCIDWESRLLSKDSIIPPPIFEEQAERAINIFEKLVLKDVIGKPTLGEVCKVWVFQFVAAIFGAYDEKTNRRLINEFFLLISKKNSKSTIAAGIMLTAMELDKRESAEYLILAPTKEVADNSFKPAKDMILENEYLESVYHIQEHTRTIKNRVTNTTLKVVAADDKAVGGGKYTGILIDELHLFGKVSKAESIFAEATGGLLSRTDGFIIKLSTQSTEPPAGVFKAELDLARDIRDGKILNTSYLPVLYEFPKSMVDNGDYKKPENFYITNPNLGASVDVNQLLNLLSKAESKGGEALTEFYAKHLNIEVGMNLRNDRWLGADFWGKNSVNYLPSLEALIEKSEVICGGIDGGGLDDLLGLAFIGRDKDNPRVWLSWSHAWANPSVLERRKDIADRLKDFARDGDLTLTHDYGEDIPELVEYCIQVRDSGKLSQIGADQLGLGSILDTLEAAGFENGTDIVGVSQGYKLSAAIIAAETRLAEGKLKHSGSAMMAWCVSNAKVSLSGNAKLITKQISGSGKIDPLMALLDAVNLMALNPEASPNMDNAIKNMIMVGI